MTLLGRLISFFPAFIIAVILAGVMWFGMSPSPLQPILLILTVYLLPPLAFRLHNHFFPMKYRFSDLAERRYSPWWGAHQIQVIFIAVPWLEGILRLIPGFYSGWLRLWGSRIGKGVYWTPNVEITDRHLLEIGDRVLCGHKCKFLGHAIKPGKASMMLYTEKIRIGNDVFIGAGSRIGPGAVVEDGVYLPALTDVHINSVIRSESCSEQSKEV